MKTLISIVPVLLMSALLSSCDANSPSTKTGDVAPILGAGKDIPPKKETPNLVGLTANMTVEEVKTIVKKNGYEPFENVKNRRNQRPVQLGPSFEQTVEKTKGVYINQKEYKTIQTLLYSKGATQENLYVHFTPFEKGPLVGRIEYNTEADNMNAQTFLARAKEKYGEPNYDSATRSTTWTYDEGDSKVTTIKLQTQGLDLTIKDPNANLSQLVRDYINADIDKKPAKTGF